MQARNVPAPQLGFNNNVKHKGRVFHIQTEDSGVNRPHITTHLFADGGHILRTERTDYSELLSSPHLQALLRQRMKEQHRAMFVALREGKLDQLIEKNLAASSDVEAAAAEIGQVVRRARSAAPPASALDGPAAPGAALSGRARDATAPTQRPPPTVRNAPMQRGAAQQRSVPSTRPPARSAARSVLPQRTLSPTGLGAPKPASTVRTSDSSLPIPAPGKRPPSTPRSRPPAAPRGSARPAATQLPPPPATPENPDRGQPTGANPSAHSSSGNHSAARPSLPGSAPRSSQASLFGTSTSEQSLDDIILSYISEDLDGD